MDQTSRDLAMQLARNIIVEVLNDSDMRTLDNFSALHDHCDANCLGGTCEPNHLIHGLHYEHEILNDAQNRVSKALHALNA